jgi:hypothetical protein
MKHSTRIRLRRVLRRLDAWTLTVLNPRLPADRR